MITEVIIPVMDQAGGEFKLVKWLKREGEAVANGEGLCEIETSKANVEISANVNGVLRKILIPEGTDIPSLTVVALIGDASDSEAVPTIDPYYRVPPELKSKQPQRVFVQMMDANLTPTANYAASPQRRGEVVASPRAKKLAAEHDVDLSTIVGTGPDGRIVEDDVRHAIEQRR
jgi:pyruvate dehydrogenase E2 component (dihydrolipoamide acetyltransferase)